LIPRWLKLLALIMMIIVGALIAWELSYRYYFFPRNFPVITGDVTRQEEATRRGIVSIYASPRYAHFDAALPRGTSPNDLKLVRVLPSGGGACNKLLFTYRYADGRLWYWDVQTDTRGYPVFDDSMPTMLPIGTGIESDPWLQVPSENCVESPQW
jgi:hypothetical protein